MDQPFFSIVIPVYNTVRELERCVSSITVQTFPDYEVILVDDGSTDGSGDLCDRLSQRDSRIKTIHKENGGCSEARNTGIRAAAGRYLMFVDSDDMWDDPKALKEIAEIITQQHDPDAVCFGVAIYDENGKQTKVRMPVFPASDCSSKEDLVRHLVYTNQYFSTSYVKALRRDFFLKHDLFFVKGLLSEDIEWSARILIHNRAMAVYPSAFYKRIQRAEGSITSNIGRKNILDILSSIEKGVVYAREHAENQRMLELYLEYWAYQYAMLLGLVSVMKTDTEYSSVLSRMQALKWLLRYDHVNKVKAVNKLVSVLGLRGAVGVLSWYYRIKRR